MDKQASVVIKHFYTQFEIKNMSNFSRNNTIPRLK